MLRKSNRKGFTLIELLVVMAIILILAGFLMPGLFSAREQAKKVNCANNMKQIATALELYASNNNDSYPATLAPLGTAGYIDDTTVFSCKATSPAVAYTYTQPTSGTTSTTVVLNDTNHPNSGVVTLYKGGNVKIK